MATITVRVAPGVGGWAASDHGIELAGGEEITLNPSRPKARGAQVAAAVAAGVLELVAGTLPKGLVESDKDSLKKQAVADRARAPMFAKRDEELNRVSAEEADEVLAIHEQAMAEVAQLALEADL